MGKGGGPSSAAFPQVQYIRTPIAAASPSSVDVRRARWNKVHSLFGGKWSILRAKAE